MSLTRPLSRPLSRSLTRTLTAGSSFLDPSAVAYLAAVQAAGATVSGGQITAVDTFYKAAKADGYYTSLKRLYLPIWGVAAANAIDMIGLTSGTFVGGVTHAAGYVQGNGSTGYFDMGVTVNDMGLLFESASAFSVNLRLIQIATGVMASVGCAPSTGTLELSQIQDTTLPTGATFRVAGTLSGQSVGASVGGSDPGIDGVLVGSRTGTDQYISCLSNSRTYAVVGSSEKTGTGILTNAYNINAMRRNAATPINYYKDGLSCYGIGLGLSRAHSASLAHELKSLVETATGLTLP